MAAPVEVTGVAVAFPLLYAAFDELKVATAEFAAAFFVLDAAAPDPTRSFMLVVEVSERVSSRTRGLAGGILLKS